MNFLKYIFYKNKILKTWDTADDEALKQWVIKKDITKELDKDNDLLIKARTAIIALINKENPKESDLKAYIDLRKKFKDIFKENNNELVNPSSEDVQNMDLMSLNEIDEIIEDRKGILSRRYFESISEIYSSSYRGLIVRPTSGGLYKSKTPTNDFIDNQPQEFNPFDDMGVD